MCARAGTAGRRPRRSGLIIRRPGRGIPKGFYIYAVMWTKCLSINHLHSGWTNKYGRRELFLFLPEQNIILPIKAGFLGVKAIIQGSCALAKMNGMNIERRRLHAATAAG